MGGKRRVKPGGDLESVWVDMGEARAITGLTRWKLRDYIERGTIRVERTKGGHARLNALDLRRLKDALAAKDSMVPSGSDGQ